MQTTIKSPVFGSATSYIDKISDYSVAAWLFTVLVLLVGFSYARGAMSALLYKLHELFIQRNIVK